MENRERPPQIIVTSKLKGTKSGGESLVFDIDLALFTLTCIAVIPDEDTDEAPVYVHFKTRRRNGGKRTRSESVQVPDDVGNR